MNSPFAHTVRLGTPGAADGDAYVTPEGFFLGDGTPLITVDLTKGGGGRARPRQEIEVALFLEAAYGENLDPAALANGLDAVARALDAGDLARAAIAAVHLGLPPIDRAAVHRLAQADRLLKGFDPNEPRDERGRWTTEAGTSPAQQVATESGGSVPAGNGGANAVVAQEFLLARPPVIPEDGIIPQFKEAIPRISGKEGAKDAPSWAEGQRPRVGESGKDFAQRLLDEKYGKGNYKKGADSEFSRIQK